MSITLNNYTLSAQRQGSPDNHGVLLEPASVTDWSTLIGPHVYSFDYISDSTEIGFTLWLSENELTTFAVSPSGWAILKGSFDSEDGPEENDHTDNTKAYDALKCLLVFPWWDKLKTADLGVRTFLNTDSNGLKYRVIDWHAYSNSTHTESSYEKVRFQAVFYESGNKIEYRYAPESTNATGQLAFSGVPLNNDYFILEDAQGNTVKYIFKTAVTTITRDLEDTPDFAIINVGINGAGDANDVCTIVVTALGLVKGNTFPAVTFNMSGAVDGDNVNLTQDIGGDAGNKTITESSSYITATSFTGGIEGTSHTSSLPGTGSSAAGGIRLVAAGAATASGEVRDFFGTGGTPDGSAAPFLTNLLTPSYWSGANKHWPGQTGNSGPHSGAAYNLEFYYNPSTTTSFVSDSSAYSTVKMLHVVIIGDDSSPKYHANVSE